MKKLFSIMIALFLVSALVPTGLATDKQTKKGGQSDYKPDKPETPEPPQPDDPNEYIKLVCKAEFQGVHHPLALNEPSTWSFRATVINKTGKLIPKGARISYSFGSSKPGYFLTKDGGAGKTTDQGTFILPYHLEVNAEISLKILSFTTPQSQNPVKVTGTAFYIKLKKKK